MWVWVRSPLGHLLSLNRIRRESMSHSVVSWKMWYLIICVFYFQIDSLTGLGVIKVECGSQFSVALTKSGAVYTWYVKRKRTFPHSTMWRGGGQLCVNVVSSSGERGIITVWVMALMTTSDGRDKFRVCKGKKSSPLQQGHSTVYAAQRMVRKFSVGSSLVITLVFPLYNVESLGLGR